MKISTTVPTLSIDGTLTGTMKQDAGVPVRISHDIAISRDIDGSWLIYTEWGGRLEDRSGGIEVHDPAACAAFDALFQLLADPRSFEKREIGEPREIAPDAA